MLIQKPSEIIDVTTWASDEFSDPFPQGARDKKAVECLTPAPYSFLRAGHRYLFKQSNENYPAQYWAEVIAYRVGCLIGVQVPPAFVAEDHSNDRLPAALIEWFYQWDEPNVRYVSGGDYIERIVPNFDRKKGTGHNLQAIMRFSQVYETSGILEGSVEHWAKVLTFDAIIGNTDRHQDNWGVLYKNDEDGVLRAEFSPAFDNGTALGHEIVDHKLYSESLSKRKILAKFILKDSCCQHDTRRIFNHDGTGRVD